MDTHDKLTLSAVSDSDIDRVEAMNDALEISLSRFVLTIRLCITNSGWVLSIINITTASPMHRQVILKRRVRDML